MNPQVVKAIAMGIVIAPTVVGVGYLLWRTVATFRKTTAETIANRRQPVASLSARVVAKRRELSAIRSDAVSEHIHYVTFETETGERREVWLSSEEFAQLSEGDVGQLSRQGTRYVGFQRQPVLAER